MNHYAAKQRTSDQKWDYTRNNRPTGYCCEWVSLESLSYASETEVKKNLKFKEKYHTCGHDTKEEAEECYKQYLLDNKLVFRKQANQQNQCEVCSAWTQDYAEVGARIFTLCEEHCNRECVENLYSAPEEAWSSW